jgi:DNA replication and repair protein RecF
MRLSHLSLTNFRNYVRLDLDFSRAVTLLQGDNAQGKTNLLEAIYYLATGISPRARTDRELINWLANEDQMTFARLEAKLEETETLREVNIVLLSGADQARKEIRINGVKRRASDLIGQVKTVLFMPENIDLIAGSPDARRSYLDTAISQIDSRYAHSLSQYNRVLTQRNSLLRILRERPGDPGQLDFWDRRLVEEGSHLIAWRIRIVTALDKLVQDIHARLTGGEERLRLLYRCSVPLEGDEGFQAYRQLPLATVRGSEEAIGASDTPVAIVRHIFRQKLRARRQEEIERGMTLMGPQRDDLRFLVGGVDMCTYGSRGQQRTIAISVKLAEMELIRAETGEEPILLLDDVMSELDEARRQCLMDAIHRGQQVIITTTDLDSFNPSFLEQAAVWRIHQGRLSSLPSTSP